MDLSNISGMIVLDFELMLRLLRLLLQFSIGLLYNDIFEPLDYIDVGQWPDVSKFSSPDSPIQRLDY